MVAALAQVHLVKLLAQPAVLEVLLVVAMWWQVGALRAAAGADLLLKATAALEALAVLLL